MSSGYRYVSGADTKVGWEQVCEQGQGQDQIHEPGEHRYILWAELKYEWDEHRCMLCDGHR